jgi:glycosyltransferase involved in cell wall biosynthesis
MEIDTVILGLPSDVKAAGIAAKLAGVKKIIYRRGTALPVKNSLLNRYLYKHVVTDVITNSFEIKKKFLQNNPSLFPQDQIHVVYNGIDIQENPHTSFLNGFPRPVILGNAGRLVEQKGQKFLIDLAAYLKVKKIDFKIKIAGKGILREELIEYARKLDVFEYIEFLDFVTDMNSFFRSIDVFVLPSIHEGSANIVIEAMAHSIPVIAFYVSSNPELIDDSQNGFLVPFGDIPQLGDKTIELITKHEFRYRMGKAARQKVIEKFDVNKSIVQLEEIF